MMTRRILAAIALLASGVADLIVVVSGVSLAAVEQSGARGTGLLLAIAGALAFAAALFVAFAAPARSRGPTGKAGAAVATICAILPVAALAGAAFAFSGVPLESALPVLDWSLFALGSLLLLGAVALAMLGWSRIRAAPRAGVVHPAADRPVMTDASDEPQSGLMYRP